MGKTINVLVLCAALAALALGGCASRGGARDDADRARQGDFEIKDGVLVKYRGSAAEVVVPAGVTAIGDEAFYGCVSLASVSLPEGVTSIGDAAFFDCVSLASINLPAGLTHIGDGTFYRCGSLGSISLPAGLTSIGGGAFYWCRSLASVSLPAGLTSIGEGVFRWCESLGAIQVDNANRSFAVRDGVLFNKELTALLVYPARKAGTSYTVPAGVTSIGDWAFVGCGSLAAISLPAGLTSIGQSAFRECGSLAAISLPAGIISIGEGAFNLCESLAAINLPDGIISIGGWAFHGCESLAAISLPESLTAIGKSAFAGCESLEAIQVDSANRSFAVRDGVLFNKAFAALLAYPAGKRDASYAVPEGVTSIGAGAFSECGSLATISLPAGLTRIGNWIFDGCESLASINLSASRPPALEYGLGTSAVIYVPAAAVDAYKEAPVWKEYADQIQAIGQ